MDGSFRKLILWSLNSLPAAKYLIWSTALFSVELFYGYNHLGVIPFEYIAVITLDGKLAGSMINQSTQIVLMDEWANDSLCCEDAKRILQSYYLFILLLFSVTIPPCSMLYFQLKGFFVMIFICAFHFQVGYWWFLKNIERPQNLSIILVFI